MLDAVDSLALLGDSLAVVRLREEIDIAAQSDAKVLVTGPSGVGKELVAGLVHAKSPRAAWPLVTVNCGAIADTLLESELFGHSRGSFTGAYRDRIGLLERAHRGTLFMDEIGETTRRMQALLLRFLQTGEIQPVGSERTQTKVDVRVIAATNRVLTQRVASGDFREDLYYRLNVIQLVVPPLRDRREDVPLLLHHFLREFAAQYQTEIPRFSEDAFKALTDHEWPGNVRELKNVVERLVISRPRGLLRREDIALDGPMSPRHDAPPSAGRPDTARELFTAIVGGRQSFWTVAYAPFVSRDLTRADLRALVSMGLERTGGDYRALTRLFNMPEGDTKRFVAMLRKYHCHVLPQAFRNGRSAAVPAGV